MICYIIFSQQKSLPIYRAIEEQFFRYANKWSVFVDEWLIVDDNWGFNKKLPNCRIIREPNTPTFIHNQRNFPVGKEVLSIHPTTLIYDPEVIREIKEGSNDFVYDAEKSFTYSRHSDNTFKKMFRNAGNPLKVRSDHFQGVFYQKHSGMADYNAPKKAYSNGGDVSITLELMYRFNSIPKSFLPLFNSLSRYKTMEQLMWLYCAVLYSMPKQLEIFYPILESIGISRTMWDKYYREYTNQHTYLKFNAHSV